MLFKTDTSLRPGESGSAQPEALDAAVQFAALLLQQQSEETAGGDDGNVLPALDGNTLPALASAVTGGEGGVFESNSVWLDELREVLPQDAADRLAAITQQIAWPNTVNVQLSGQDASTEVVPVLSVATPAAATALPSALAPPLAKSSVGLAEGDGVLPPSTLSVPLKSPDQALTLDAADANPATALAHLLTRRGKDDLMAAGRANAALPVIDAPLPSTQSAASPTQSGLPPPILQLAQVARGKDRDTIQSLSAIDIRLPDNPSTAQTARVAQIANAAATPFVSENPTPQLMVGAKIGDPDWSRQFAERVGWVIHARLGTAQVRLNPEHLGPVEMRIEVDDNNTRVQFVAGQPLTRDAIENSLPRLRELLEQQGMQLTDADVRDAPKERPDGGETAFANPQTDPDEISSADHDTADRIDTGAVALTSASLVDTYV
ncbi:MAG: flagellar hook-length control protein FliK [Pseudomonadota bacterium]